MKAFKSSIILMCLLIVIQPVLQGCTAINYKLGKDLDESYPYKKIKVKDYDKIKIGDMVEVVLQDETRIRGRITDLNLDEQIVISDIGLNGKKRFTVETVKFQNIDHIYKLDYLKQNRFVFACWGLVQDVFLGLFVYLLLFPIEIYY